MDRTNVDQNVYAFAPTYGYESTAFHRHIISVVVFSYKKVRSMLIDCAVIEMGCSNDYSDAVPRVKTIRGNVITNFLLHVDQSITFNQTEFVTETLISEARLKLLY